MFHSVLTTWAMSAAVVPGVTTLDELASALRAPDTQAGTWEVHLDDDAVARLSLEPFAVLADDALVVVQGESERRKADLGGLRLWRGTINGDPSSSVFLATSRHGVNGYVQQADTMLVLSDRQGTGAVTVIDMAEVGPVEHQPCSVRTVDGIEPRPVETGATRGEGTTPPCRVAALAIDTDWEFTENTFSGDPDAAAAYAVTLAGGISHIYIGSVNTRFEVDFVRVWDADNDPYGPPGDLLDQFRNEWTTNMGDVERTVAHMLSGRNDLPYGGVAWLSVLCNESYGFGLSGYINGFFPQPVEDNHPDNWDLLVMAHELGHNFGTLHTHDGYSPPIDNCGNGDCTGAEDGTIMSYCHVCDGGVSNIAMSFHPQVQDTILGYLDSIEPECDLQVEEGGGSAIDDETTTFQDVVAHIDVLVNDQASDCVGDFMPEIDHHDEVSEFGGAIELLDGDGMTLDVLVYTPAEEFVGTDTFAYTLVQGGSAMVTVDVVFLRPPDTPGSLVAGAHVSYYDNDVISQLPDYDSLSPYATDVLEQVNLESTNGEFATSGLSDHVGAVVTGYMQVPADGLYTLSIESDDGSRLWIGDALVADNDGTHGMEEVGGIVGLQAGRHEIRIEFFERTGSAGLIARFEGPGLVRQPIPAGAWSHQPDDTVPCPEDVNGDGAIDVNDLLEVISEWGPCGADCSADVNQDGVVAVDDVLAILSAWGTSCP